MTTFNATKINCWNQCELQYYAYYLLKIEMAANLDSKPELKLGTLLHKYFQNFYKDTTKTQIFKSNAAQSLVSWKNNFIAEWKQLAEECAFVSLEEQEAYLEKGILALDNFYKREKSRDFKIPIFLEQWFTVDLGAFKLNGKIDRIDRELDGSITIIDYKISNRVKSYAQAQQDHQLSIYYLACEQNILREKPSKVSLYYPLQDETIHSIRNEEHINDLLESILGIDQAIKERGMDNKKYKTDPIDWKCSFCNYREACPEFKFERSLELPDRESILEKTEELINLNRQIKPLLEKIDNLKAEIKEYMIAQELKNIGDCSLSKSQSSFYDPIKLWDLIRSLEDGYQYIKLDSKSLEENLEFFNAEQQKIIKAAKMLKEPVHRLNIKSKTNN